MKVPKPDPSSLKTTSAISPIFPSSFSPAKPTPIGLTSAPKTRPSDVFPVSSGNISSSFGKPSSYAISTPTLLPDAPANTGIFKPQPPFQDSSFKEPGKLIKGPNPSTGGTPVFEPVDSSQNIAVSSPEPGNLTSGVPKPTLQNKHIYINIGENTEPPARVQSQAPAENNLQYQKSLSYPTPLSFDPNNQDVTPISSQPHLPLEKPKILQNFPSTGRTLLSPQDIPPISRSFASNQKIAAAGNGTTVNGSSVDPRHSLTRGIANLSPPSVSLAALQTNSSPNVTSIQESSATDLCLLPQNLPPPDLNTRLDATIDVSQDSAVRTNLPGTFMTKTIHTDQRSIMLTALSDGIMHNDGALLQQFVEYVIGPIIVDSIRETRDGRSWKRASQWLSTPSLSAVPS